MASGAAWAGLEAAVGGVGAAESGANPFAYEVDRLAKIDPKLFKYDQAGAFSTRHREPRRIVLGPSGDLFIATGDGVEVVDSQGNFKTEIGLGSPARCVSVAGDGTVYIGRRSQIEVFSPKGQPLSTWETPSRKTWFTGLCVGANELFAADSANRVVLHYDRSGKLLGRIGEKNPQRNIPGLIVPSPYLDVVLGADGLLRVNNPGRHRVDVFTPQGDLEFSWGKPSLAIEGFCGCCNPIGLEILPDGRCITCEKGLPRVKVYTADPALESVVAGPDLFRESGRPGLTVDHSDGTLGGLDAAVGVGGSVYILDLVSAKVRIMKPKA